MNKSKILKRSLAVILAMMMIFAMIPLSASAADAPTLSSVTVNNLNATLSGDEWSVSVSGGQITLGAVGTPGADAQYKDKADGEWKAFANNLQVAAIATASGNVYTLPIRVIVLPGSTSDSDVGTYTEYTLKITVTASAKSSDTTIKAVKNVNGMTSYVIEGGVITINVPFGTAVQGIDPVPANFTASSDAATVSDPAATDANGVTTFIVTAEDGSTFTYTVKVVAAEGLTSVSVEDQIGEAKFSDDGKTVDILMPFEYFGGAATPEVALNFTHGANIAKVTAGAYADAAITSGDTVALTRATANTIANQLVSGGVTLNTEAAYTYTLHTFASATAADQTVTVRLIPQKVNTEAEISEITVWNNVAGDIKSNPTAVSGKTVAVEMPTTYTTKANAATLKITASPAATVSVPAQGVTDTDNFANYVHDGVFELDNVNLTGDSIIVRVTAGNGTYADYTVTISKASEAKAEITDYSLKGKYNGETVTYTGTIDQTKKTITVKLPYALSGAGALDAFTVYATYSVGSHLYTDLDKATAKTSAVEFSHTYNDGTKNAVDPSAATNWAATLVAQNDTADSVRKTYTVIYTFEAAKQARNLSKLTLTNSTTFAGITDDNTFTSTVKTGVTTSTGTTVDTIQVGVPNKYDGGNVYATEFTVSDGAVVYVRNAGDNGWEKLAAHAKGSNATAMITLKNPQSGHDPAFDADGVITVANATPIIVLSEANAVAQGDTITDTTDFTSTTDWKKFDANTDKYHLYYVGAVLKPAEKEANLLTVASTLDENVKVSFNKSAKVVTITVPSSYVGPSTWADRTSFSLNLTSSSQAKVEIGTVAAANAVPTGYNALVSDSGSTDSKNAATWFHIFKNGDNKLVVRITEDGKHNTMSPGTDAPLIALAANTTDTQIVTEQSIRVTSEDTLTSNMYAVQFIVADAKTEAKLLTAKVGDTAAVVNETAKTATLSLPYGSKLNPVSLALTASDMATINVSTDNKATWTKFNPATSYDLNNGLFIQVVSEDEKTKNVYELKATVAEQFSDVKDNAWYAKNVAAAAAAGIISGYTDGTFRPNGEVTRAEFAQMLVNMLGVDTSAYTTSAFKDVNETAYYSDEVAYIKDAGITAGYPDGTFRPNGTISRQEAAVMLAKALKLTATTDSKFADDAAIASWAKTPAYQCKAAQIFNGDGEGNFLPGANLTRAQAASIMVNSLANK